MKADEFWERKSSVDAWRSAYRDAVALLPSQNPTKGQFRSDQVP